MVEGIVTTFVVLAIFAVVALLLTLYVWRCDPDQFALQIAAVRARRKGRHASTPRSLSSVSSRRGKPPTRRLGGLRGVVRRPAAAADTMPPVIASGKSASARLEYWFEIGRHRRAP
jgi:hypothetical protein